MLLTYNNTLGPQHTCVIVAQNKLELRLSIDLRLSPGEPPLSIKIEIRERLYAFPHGF